MLPHGRAGRGGVTPSHAGYCRHWYCRYLAAARSRAGRDISAIAHPGLVFPARAAARLGFAPRPGLAGCCRGFQSPLAPVLRSTSPPRMSLWSASAAVAVALAVAAYLLRRSRFFVTAVLIAAVAAGFATATPSGRRISLMLC